MEQETPFRISRKGTFGDLTALYQDREDFACNLKKAREDINQFSRTAKGNLHI